MPVGSSVAVFAVLTVLMTMIGCALFFDKMRKAVKDENFVKLEVNEQVDRTVYESLQGICLPAIFAFIGKRNVRYACDNIGGARAFKRGFGCIRHGFLHPRGLFAL